VDAFLKKELGFAGFGLPDALCYSFECIIYRKEACTGMDQKDYYEVLGVEKTAGAHEIKEAYRNLAFRYHPDRNHANSDAMEKMKAVNEAYAVLSNRDKKKEYDAMRQQFGNSAYSQFKKAYTEQEIYKDSDIHHIFEEMARSFGIRGFDEIFKEAQAQKSGSFEYKRPGIFVKGFAFSGWLSPGFLKLPMASTMGKLFRSLLGISSRPEITHKGKDIHDTIYIQPDQAAAGGPFAYYHREKAKKLVVKIPPRIKSGQKIRLAGMGEDGKGGGVPGDLLITVSVRKSIIDNIRKIIGSIRKQ